MSIDEQQYFKKRTTGVGFLLVGILLIAANLRAPMTSVGPLVPIIRDSLNVPNTAIGMITTLPLIAFALVSPISPKIANKFGMERTIFASMIILAAGMIIRSITGVGTLFIGTALIGIAISFGNVLLPGFVKLSFPFRIGLMTGLYTVCMNVFGAIASGVSVPITNIDVMGWQGALGVWGIVTLIALIVWLPQIKKPADLPEYDVSEEEAPKKTNLWTSATAWQITIFMGIQSLMFYTMLTWLPDILILKGYSSNETGWMLTLLQFALIPVTFIIPLVADKLKSHITLGAISGSCFIIGTLGLLLGSPVAVVISVILWGIGCGSGFSMSMMFFTLRTKDAYAASDLSGMAQSIGYLLAAVGPMLFGGLHDLSGSWTPPIMALLAGGVILLICGTLAGRNTVIDK